MDNLMLRRRLMMQAKGIWATVTGTSPLTLQNALKAKMRSLIQYGAMTQSPTPTPDAPVYPSINNGTVQMVDDELPAGYKRLLGITFDGNFHYRTGEYLTSDDVVTMTLDNLSTSGKNVFGSYNGANGKNLSLYIYGSSTSGSYFRFGDVLKRPIYGGTGRRTITFGAGGTSGFAEDVSIAPDEFTTPANTYIGMLPNSGSAAYTGDIVGSILVGTRLEWIPCESDGGVIGYYERVNGNFIAPTGDGTPVSLGYDNSHLVPRVVGTDEILSLSHNARDAHYVQYLNAYLRAANRQITAYNGNSVVTFDCEVGQTYRCFDLAATGNSLSVNVGFSDTIPGIGYTYSADDFVSIPVEGGYRTNGLVFTATKRYATFIFRYDGDSAQTPESMLEQMLFLEVAQEQTATVPDLYAVGDYKDEVDVVSGTVTRRVGMVRLTGNEEWTAKDQYNRVSVVVGDMSNPTSPRLMPAICTHYENIHNGEAISTVTAGQFYTAAPKRLYFHISEASTADFKSYLAAQYAAGTPVVVWYPLATPYTESIAGQSLRTVEGTTVVDSSAGSVELAVEYKATEEPTLTMAPLALNLSEPAGLTGSEATDEATDEAPDEAPDDGESQEETEEGGEEA